MYCGKCGTENSADSKFCLKCGSPLAAPDDNVSVQPNAGPRPSENKFVSFLKRRWMILAPALALLIILLLCLNSIITAISPSYAVLRATKNTMVELNERLESSSLNFLMVLGECLQDGTVETQFSYDDGYYTQADGSIMLLNKSASKEYGLVTSLTINDVDVDLTTLFNNKRMAFQTSLIDDQYYGITYDSFKSDLDQFARVADLDDELVDSLKQFYDYMTASSDNDITGMTAKYNELFESFVRELKPAVTSEKIKSGHDTVSCKVVTYQITDEDIVRLFRDLQVMLEDDEDLRDYLYTAFEAQSIGEDYSFGYYEDADDMYDDLLDGVDDIIDAMEDEMSGAIAISYYLSGNTLVRWGLSGDPEIDNEKLEFECTIDFGKHPATNDIECVFNAEDDYGSEYELELTFRTATQGDTITNAIELNADEDGYDNTVSFVTEWNKKTGFFETTIETDYDDYVIRGNLTFDKDGFKLVLDDILDDFYAGENLELTFIAHKTVSIPDPQYVNMDQWDDDFLDDLEEGFEDLMY